MLAEYLEKKLEQYKVATKLADRAWEEIVTVNQTGGALQLDDDKKEILKEVGALEPVEGIDKLLDELQAFKIDDMVSKLQGFNLSKDDKDKAISALVDSLILIRDNLNSSTKRIKGEKEYIMKQINNGAVSGRRNEITRQIRNDEDEDVL